MERLATPQREKNVAFEVSVAIRNRVDVDAVSRIVERIAISKIWLPPKARNPVAK